MKRISPRVLLALAVLPYVAFTLSQLDYVAMWDGREYAECIEQAVRAGSFPLDFNCANHPTFAYTGLVSLLQRLVKGQYWPLLLGNLAIGLAGLFAFYDLAKALFDENEADALILTACLGVFPVYLAATVNVNPDAGLVAFFVLAVRSLVRDRPLQAALTGFLLSFTKETGVVLYSLAVGTWALVMVLRADGPVRYKLQRLVRHWAFLVPPLLFVLFLVFNPRRRTGDVALWGTSPKDLFATFTTFKLTDRVFLAQLAGIFLLQFLWVPTVFAFARWLKLLARAIFALPWREPRQLVFLDALMLLTTLLLTRYRTFLNLRYYLAIAPLLLLSAMAGLRSILPAVRDRVAAMAVLLALFAVSTFRTVDPVAKGLFGTFAFGSHPMLNMTSITGECCGYGRDQIVYNLEHTYLHRLQDLAYAQIQPGPGQEIALPEAAHWWLVGSLDPVTHLRTLSPVGTVKPHAWVVPELSHARKRPDQLYFLRMPNVPLDEDEEVLQTWYDPVGAHTYQVSGYTLEVVLYQLKKQ